MKKKNSPIKKLSIVFLGTYDLDKPRVKILLESAKSQGFIVTQCHANIWEGIIDKSVISLPKFALRLLRAILAYPILIIRYLTLPKHDAVIIGYPGFIDVFILGNLVRLRGIPVILDVLIPIYEAVVEDRKMISQKAFLAHFIYWFEWLSYRIADINFLDTASHSRYLENKFKLAKNSVPRIFVGTERKYFYPATYKRQKRFTVLFYGQFIPLHGIDTIIDAATELERKDKNISFILIGTGQESARIDKRLDKIKLSNVTRIKWVQHESLINYIHNSDICLGNFGTSYKAHIAISNKIFQILACQRPLITMDSIGIREIIHAENKAMRLIPPKNGEALAQAILSLYEQDQEITSTACKKLPMFDEKFIGKQLKEVVEQAISAKNKKL